MSGEPTVDTVPFVDLRVVHATVQEELHRVARRVIDSGVYANGPEVVAFERALSSYCGTERAIGLASGTCSITLMLRAAGIGPGDEVLVPANTFWASAEGIHHAGARPVLVDVLPTTANIDPAAAAAAVTSRTRAVLAVHLYGQPADMTALRALSDRHGLLLLEDAAQAIGARWEGRRTGSLGDAASFSFYPGKNLGALGEAGAVTTDDPDLDAVIRRLRSHGEERRYVHTEMGFNERMDEIQAAFLTVKLAGLVRDQARRDHAVNRYLAALATIDGVRLFDTDPRATHVHHLLVVRVAERDEVLRRLQADGIGAAVHYPNPLHRQPGGTHLARIGQFPVAERLGDQILSLPLFAGITDAQVDRCVEVLAARVGSTSPAVAV